MTIQSQILLAPLTSWLIGGPAEFFCQPSSEDELEEAVLWADQNKKSVTILGGGTNSLVSDHGVSGLVISMRKFSKIVKSESATSLDFNCWAGTPKSELLKIFLKHKNPAALFLAGLPGDVGGGVVMNAGVSEAMSPREFGEIVTSIEVWLPESRRIVKKIFSREQIMWDYRHSSGWTPGLIAKVLIQVPRNENLLILEQVKQANRLRLQKQPLDMPSCGSVFINPPSGLKAAQLIESSGLKGRQVGQAQVSMKHANFIVNLGGATATDTWNLILQVQSEVSRQRGIQLKTEVIRLGNWDPS